MKRPVTKAKAPTEQAFAAVFERAMVHARLALPLAVVVGALIAGLTMGIGSAILILAGAALVAAISVFWASVRTLLGETPLSGADAYAIGAPRGAEHEQKHAILRALKDLEFERSVGKISAEDYRELSASYWAEGKRLLKEIDDQAKPRRALVEALIEARLAEAGLAEGAQSSEHAEEEAKLDVSGDQDEEREDEGADDDSADDDDDSADDDDDSADDDDDSADDDDESADDEADEEEQGEREKGHA